MLGNPDRRIRWILLIFILIFCVVSGRAVFLQVVSADTLTGFADEQHEKTIELPARRGTIYDRTGNELAVGEETRSIYATPYLVEDPEATAETLAPILHLEADGLLAKLSDDNAGFAYLARKVDPGVADVVEQLEIEGLGFLTEEKRVYPQKQLAAQVLGYAGMDNQGIAGMELQMDEALKGIGGRKKFITDAGGTGIEMLSLEEGARGTDVWLTIDQAIQFETEKLLNQAVKEWKAKGATAIVMNPNTGDIYAMVNAPTVDANAFDQLQEEQRRNRAVTDMYEPGSVFKAITATAALEEDAVTPEQSFNLPVTLEVGGRTIEDAYERGPVDWTLQDIIENSSNIGAVTVGMALGGERLNDWIYRFGFDSLTGIDFPGETSGLVRPLDQWSGSTIGNVPMGQGVSVTAIQLAAAYSAIANGGIKVQPRLVYRIGDVNLEPAAGEKIISARTTGYLTKYLTQVVEGVGAPLARVEGYTVAGKTGTAQKPLPDGSGYSSGSYIASFVGFAPAADPQVVILVSVDEPRDGAGGGAVSAPVFQKIAQFTLQRLSIAP